MSNEEKQITVAKESRAVSNEGVFSGVGQFEDAQRMAKALSAGGMIPKDYQNNIPNTLVAMEMANRIGMSPVAVMQNVHIIHGKPSWSSKFIIAAINGCGRFSPLRFHVEGEGDNKTCYAYAVCKVSGDRLDGPEASIRMAKAEGWMGKNGSKWKTMPDLMLRYRAATFFGNLYAPDILMGFSTADESEDIHNAGSRQAPINQVNEDIGAPPPIQDIPPVVEGDFIEAEVVEEYHQQTQQPANRKDI